MSAATQNEMERLREERDALAEKLAVATKRLEDGHLAPVGWISGDRYEAVSREKMDYRRRWKEVCEERDTLANRVDFLNQQNSAQQEQNDELTAHVEAMVAWADAYVGTTGLYEEVESARNANTSSLARLKAQWQADELSAMIAALPFGESLARGMLKHRRDELRRRVEGGE